MEVILLERIRNLGVLGDRVNVKPGYGRNYLIPQGKAVYATAKKIAEFEVRRAELEKVVAQHVAEAQTRQAALTALASVQIIAKAGDEGKLFGSIGTRDIAEAITLAGVEVNKSEVSLPNGLLRQVGEYDIEIELYSDVAAVVKIQVLAEGAKDEG